MTKEADDLIAEGYAAYHRDDLPEALRKYHEGAAIYMIGNQTLKLASAIRHMGDIYRDLGELAAAEPCYNEALSIYRSIPNCPVLPLANCLRPMGLLWEARGEPEAAPPFWSEARNIYAKLGIDAGVAECDRHLAALGHSPSQ